MWRGGGEGEPALLRSAYENSLKLAAEEGVKRIAFPAISTGVYGYPLRPATQIAVSTALEYADDFDAIIFCCFNEAVALEYREVIRELCA